MSELQLIIWAFSMIAIAITAIRRAKIIINGWARDPNPLAQCPVGFWAWGALFVLCGTIATWNLLWLMALVIIGSRS